ncbi:hypothetical protein [Stenotrophomonas lactitubi]|uniref:hypothetical protein n=1 Tax=Stenotrophomonas lactitubi TaxID=2045214 RepID=UPI001DAD94C0|nr:hypothetical protein [Stenotrophomonas lactitubi]CAH0254907.1 hypothetical protein SRABI35_03053 [Stenotrophomonas lactitubi]
MLTMDGMDYRFGSKLPARAERSAQYLLVRLLVGGGVVKRKGGRGKYTQSNDLSCWPSVRQVESSAVATADFIRVQLGSAVSEFIAETIVDNRRLFSDILSELSNYYCASAAGSHAAAFVYLYRTLERISFSVPLLYCATSSDFYGTFEDLKKLFDEGAKGDLSLLRKLISQGRFIDRTVVDTTVTLDLSTSPYGEKFYHAIVSRFDDTDSSDSVLRQISMKFGSVQGFTETVRNRFFHFRTGDGRNNMSTRDLVDVDQFFQYVNPVVENFIGKLVVQTIVTKYGRL